MVGTRGDGTAGRVEGRVINGLLGSPREWCAGARARRGGERTLYRTEMPLGSAARVVVPAAVAIGKRTCQGCLEPSTGAPERFGSKRSGGEWGAPDAPQARATRLHSTLRTSIQLRKATRPQSASSRYQLRGDDRRPSMASIPSIARR